MRCYFYCWYCYRHNSSFGWNVAFIKCRQNWELDQVLIKFTIILKIFLKRFWFFFSRMKFILWIFFILNWSSISLTYDIPIFIHKQTQWSMFISCSHLRNHDDSEVSFVQIVFICILFSFFFVCFIWFRVAIATIVPNHRIAQFRNIFSVLLAQKDALETPLINYIFLHLPRCNWTILNREKQQKKLKMKQNKFT